MFSCKGDIGQAVFVPVSYTHLDVYKRQQELVMNAERVLESTDSGYYMKQIIKTSV